MKTVIIYTFSFLILLISGCSKDKIPGVYRIDIQQGNDITQEMMSQLKPGMSKSQVAYVMGTPLIIDTFHPDRWDYLYSFHPGNGQREQRRITIYFKQDQLDYLDGNTRTVALDELPEIVRMDSNVIVPLSNKKIGLIPKIKETIGMEDDDTVIETKPDLFKNRPIPVPTTSTGIIDRIADSVSSDDTQESIQEIESIEEESARPSLLKRFIGLDNDEANEEALHSVSEPIDIEESPVTQVITKEVGFFDRIKNAVGLGKQE
jgi:outer membrane protein assembly factor BamE